MGFERVKIVDPYVEKGWTEEVKLTLATSEEVIKVESKLNLSFPKGYKEFVTTFGKGTYCGHNTGIRVDMPSEILSDFKEEQQFLEMYWFWEASEDVISKEKAVECIRILDTDIGDRVIFHPTNSSEIFVLPHEDDFSYKINGDLHATFDWLVMEGSKAANGTKQSLKRRFFVPDNPLAERHGVLYPEGHYEK